MPCVLDHSDGIGKSRCARPKRVLTSTDHTPVTEIPLDRLPKLRELLGHRWLRGYDD